ncbi:MAG TPA: hypothetical protein VGE66_11795 [Chitinophagaceae bacterium]
MKPVVGLLLIALLTGCAKTKAVSQDALTATPVEMLVKDTLIKFPANPGAGFHFEYLVLLPRGIEKEKTTPLMVETNNTGLNDTITVHEKGARRAASHSGVGVYVAKKLRLPFLVPIFPRSQTDWTVYTHALDRDAFVAKGVDYERLDLQLLAMVEDAKKRLAAMGYPLEEKFLLTGFSASGTFANRLSLLHPAKIKAVATGGINAIAILPVAQVKGKTLNYPLGLADVEAITGQPVDLEAFRALPKLLYMGAKDDNDAAAFSDGYSDEERALVYGLMGKQMIPTRWSFMESQYRLAGVQAQFKTYEHMGHGTDLVILDELVAYFKTYVE